MFYLGVPDTTPELTTEANLEAHLLSQLLDEEHLDFLIIEVSIEVKQVCFNPEGCRIR